MVTASINTRLRPLQALRAVRRLLAQPEDTGQVFIILRALRGRSTLRMFRRFSATEIGQTVLRGRKSLLPVLDDTSALAALPDGTLGRAYRRFMAEEDLSAAGLAAAVSPEWREAQTDDIAFLQERLRDSHDLTHVVTGYGRDPLGEVCLLAFMFAQNGNLGMALIAFFGLVRCSRSHDPAAARAAVLQGWRHGRRASWLGGQNWETLLGRPLPALREELRIAEPTRYQAALAAA